MKLGQGLCFYMCLWFCSQGGSAPLHTGIHTHPTTRDQRQVTPPPEQTPPGADPPPGQEAGTTPPRSRHPPGPEAGTPAADPSNAVHAGRYGQPAGGTHPIGMQSCLSYLASHRLSNPYKVIESSIDPSPKSEAVHETKFILKNLLFNTCLLSTVG